MSKEFEYTPPKMQFAPVMQPDGSVRMTSCAPADHDAMQGKFKADRDAWEAVHGKHSLKFN
jgi:hypothetical protein